MPNDLYYFYESDLNKGSWTDFVNSLPHHLQEMFKNSMGEGVVGKGPANVLQGYRGPHNNGTSGDSGYLGASNGLQEVRYWWGASKHMNWVPISGWIAYGICSAIGDTNWHSLYFDSKTGECLSHNKNQATEKLNNKGWQLFQEGKYSEAAEYFNNAYQACSSGYQNEQTFKNNIDKAKAELDAINLNSQGDNLFNQGRYHEAHSKYQEAYDKSQVSTQYNKYSTNRDKAKAELDAISLNSQSFLPDKSIPNATYTDLLIIRLS
ncbi:tetratricopeptide repeat protein [Rickettsia rhipicephali]